MRTNELKTESLQNKPHFEVLDGMRGVAAIAVVIFHFMEWIYTDYTQNFIGHGFLAVDFFFCLSGFVIGYAYDSRMGKMGILEFFTLRIIRLHPLVVLGSVLGLLGFLFDPFENTSELYTTGKLVVLFGCSVLLVPFPVMEDRAFNLFGFNAPAWSLFWEYIANVAYACMLYRLSRRYLIIATILAAVLLGWVGYRAGNLLGGWGKDSFWDGGARVAYSFLAGLLIHRSQWILKNRLGFIGLAVLLCGVFLMPSFPYNWLAEALVIWLYFPLLVALGAGTAVSAGMKKVCVFLGNVSYPLYMTHYAVIWIFGHYCTLHKPAGYSLYLFIALAVVALIGLATVVMVFYDIPVRTYLLQKLRKSKTESR